MKPTLWFAAIISSLIILSGCEKFKEKRFSTTIPYDIEIDLAEGESTTIDVTGQLTSMINSELEKVKDEIKSYELVSIEYKIFEFWGASPNAFTGNIGFGNANSTGPGANYAFNDIDLQAGNDNPNRVKMNLNSQDIAKIQQYFLDTNGLKLYLTGNASQTPVHFIMQVVVNVDAIAEVKK